MMSVMCRRDAAGVGALAVAAVLTASGTCWAQWSDYAHYQIERIGLYGAEYTATNGTQSSTATQISPGGQVLGTSTRYSGNTALVGARPWVWTGSSTVQLGFSGSQYVGTTGQTSNTVAGISDTGQVAGHTLRLTGVSGLNGVDSWVWTGTQQIRVGLTDAMHTATSGRQDSRILQQNAAGQVAGLSFQYSGNSKVGQTAWVWKSGVQTTIGLGPSSHNFDQPRLQNAAGIVAGITMGNGGNTFPSGDAWVWDGVSTRRIGLFGPEYLEQEGENRYCVPELISPAGHVAGVAARGGIPGPNGYVDAWIWNGTATTRIGLVGGRYTGIWPGEENSRPLFLNAAGHVAGFSTAISARGQDSWIWNGAATVQIGLTDGAHTFPSGLHDRESTPTHMNASGMVAGRSARYRYSGTPAPSSAGQSAWVWNGVETQRIGLIGSEYTNPDGSQDSVPLFLNDAGQVVGTSRRYGPDDSDGGQDAWVWRNNITSPVGLFGGVYEGSDGFRSTTPRFQNAAGIVVGTTNRIGGISDIVGTDAWYFDPTSGATSSIIGSVRTTDNFTGITLSLLTETGFLLGNYKYFEGGLGAGVDRAFVFRPDLGLADLGALVEGGLDIAGWSELLSASRSVDLTYIIGRGLVGGQSLGASAYIMTIPAPGSLAVFGVFAVAARRRRR